MLGPTPAAIYPDHFVSEEAARNAAEDTMLLMSTGRQRHVCSTMYFNGIEKTGIVAVKLDPVDVATGIIVVFGGRAGGMVWQLYPLVRELIMKEAPHVRQSTSDVAVRLYEAVRELCGCGTDDDRVKIIADRVQRSIVKTILALDFSSEAGCLAGLDLEFGDAKERLSDLRASLERSRSILKDKVR